MSSWIKNINLEGDRTIWGVVFSLSLFSVLVVYSTAGWHFLFNHIIKLLSLNNEYFKLTDYVNNMDDDLNDEQRFIYADALYQINN